MKNLLLLSATAMCFSAGTSYATDDFGTRFTDRTPAGFSDTAPNDDIFSANDFDPSLIEPAAGEEEQDAPQGEQEPQAESEQDTKAEPSQPATETE